MIGMTWSDDRPCFVVAGFLFVFETRSHYVAQAGLKFEVLLPLSQPPER
jgi:hypothetical protein